jgi:tetratricopeptide (TPR) repeat protein
MSILTKDFEEALVTFKRTVSILGQHYSEDSLIVAKALDKIGLSATLSPSQENLDWALLALHEAFHIRYAQLGPHHCDVVDTLNNIAGVYLHKKRWENARDAYIDVLTVRVAIFGRNHPSVAITAQTLGKVFSHLSDFRNALNFMELALTVYREEPMALKDNHPLVGKTLKGIASIERLMDSLGKSD